jgi:SAM-dependent methyltransferase
MIRSSLDPTQRFSSRVDNYIKYRPHYPRAVLNLFRRECGLAPTAVVADIGSGTGILTELLLQNGNRVFAVEPNREMREAAERLLKSHPLFHSVSGTAEATTLKPESVDLITAGQSFHWFDQDKTRTEFCRILKPGGCVALVWNDRDAISQPFSRAYEQLVQAFGTDYAAATHRQIDANVIGSFFGANGFKSATFPNEQAVDEEGLKGRLMSSSYAPEPGHPKHEPMLKALRELFEKYQTGGTVAFDYHTIVYYGRLVE